jgi:hypothetical protein
MVLGAGSILFPSCITDVSTIQHSIAKTAALVDGSCYQYGIDQLLCDEMFVCGVRDYPATKGSAWPGRARSSAGRTCNGPTRLPFAFCWTEGRNAGVEFDPQA